MSDMRDAKAKEYDAVVSGLRDEPCAFKRQCFRDGWDAAIAALPDMVRPLQWDCTDWSAGDGIKGENDCEWTAEVWPMTSYIISWFGGERFEVCTPLDEKFNTKSLSDAKDVAQAHYAAQSVSAFGVQGGEA